MVLAGPLSTLVGFVASRYDQRVDQAQARESALLRSSHLRDLALALAVHRGLSARILAGEESASTELVQQQKQVDRLLYEAQESIPADQWRTANPARGPSLVAEVHDLMRDLHWTRDAPAGVGGRAGARAGRVAHALFR